MPDTILGLDIGQTTVKAVQIVGGIKGFQVTGCAQVDIDPEDGLRPAIASLHEKMGINGDSCISALSPDHVSFRNLTLPFTDRKKIDQTLGYELEALLPFPIDDVTTSHILAKGEENNTSVFAACVQNELLKEHMAALSESAMEPDVIEVGGGALVAQLMKEKDGPKNIFLLDIGAKTSSLTVLLNGITVLIRSYHFGGDRLTEAIATSQKVDVEEAEALKRKSSSGEWTHIIEPVVIDFCNEIQNTLHAFRCQVTEAAVPQDILLTGGGALFPDLPPVMEKALGLPVELLDLGARMNVDFDDSVSEHWNPLTMNNALALAFRDIRNKNSFNLRTGQFKKTRRYDELRGEAKRFIVYLSAIILVLCAQFGANYYVLQKQKDHLGREIKTVFSKTLPDVKNIVKPVHQMKIKIRETKEAMLLPADLDVQDAVVDILRDVTLRIPKSADLDVTSFVVDEERVRLKGLTDTFNTVDEIKNGVQGSTYFKEVSIGSAQLDRGSGKVRFELVMAR